MESLINSLDDAVVSVDECQNIAFLNEAAARLWGCERLTAVGQPLKQFPLLAEAWRQLQRDHRTSLAPAGSRVFRRVDLQQPDGQQLCLEAWTVRPARDGNGALTAVFRDLTLQRQMEQAVYQARKHQAVGALATGLTHDFNNILTAVISQIDLVLYSPLCPQSLKANLSYAQASARRGADLVARLQLFSRHSLPKLAPVDLQEILEQVVFILRRSLDPRTEVRLEASVGSPRQVRADFSQLVHALVHFGLNARDAMPNGGQITLQLSPVTIAPIEARPPKKAGEFMRITVADTGPGLSAENLARLTESSGPGKEGCRRAGLGLSVPFSIVADHGGWVEGESHSGQGTQFHIFLPRAAESKPAASPPESQVNAPAVAQGHERILIVDDEPAVRSVIRAVLAYRGYSIVEAANGEEALRQYRESAEPIHLVLMDLHMPRLNGRDALLRIQAHNPAVKAILLSGGLQEQEPDSTVEVAGVRFLQKPFDNQQLAAVVREVLDGQP